jgi:hypothetical protein
MSSGEKRKNPCGHRDPCGKPLIFVPLLQEPVNTPVVFKRPLDKHDSYYII